MKGRHTFKFTGIYDLDRLRLRLWRWWLWLFDK